MTIAIGNDDTFRQPSGAVNSLLHIKDVVYLNMKLAEGLYCSCIIICLLFVSNRLILFIHIHVIRQWVILYHTG